MPFDSLENVAIIWLAALSPHAYQPSSGHDHTLEGFLARCICRNNRRGSGLRLHGILLASYPAWRGQIRRVFQYHAQQNRGCKQVVDSMRIYTPGKTPETQGVAVHAYMGSHRELLLSSPLMLHRTNTQSDSPLGMISWDFTDTASALIAPFGRRRMSMPPDRSHLSHSTTLHAGVFELKAWACACGEIRCLWLKPVSPRYGLGGSASPNGAPP